MLLGGAYKGIFLCEVDWGARVLCVEREEVEQKGENYKCILLVGLEGGSHDCSD